MSPGPMETIFFGPQVGSTVKCSGGGSASRLEHSRLVHKEICELLLGAVESLKNNLIEFTTVLPRQWSVLVNASPSDNLDTGQRLRKIADNGKVF